MDTRRNHRHKESISGSIQKGFIFTVGPLRFVEKRKFDKGNNKISKIIKYATT